ncbi:MAG: hypothetical protein HOP21_06320 [Methylotenera sp.]|nr:hypothetical protein [Methylotenera sp.]
MKRYVQSAPSQIKALGFIAAAILLSASQTVWAAGTASGTTISNLATLSYSVGAVAQPVIGSSSTGNLVGAGTPTTFVVDNKVNLTVVEANATFTSVVPGQTAAVTQFTVTNNGNTVQDYALTGGNVSGTPTVFTVADNFDATSCGTFVESGVTVGYQLAQDTALFIDELAADASKTVYVVCSIPNTQVNGDQAVTELTATTRAGGSAGGSVGAAISQTAGADTAGVDIVFADPATAASVDGTIPLQTARDAIGFARDAFRVASAVISVQKTVTLVCDPFNGITNPKNIPGAIERWTITISNAGAAAASASLAQVSDTLNAATTFDPNLVAPTNAATCGSGTGVAESAAGSGFKLDVTGDTRPGTYPKYLTTTADADGATHAASLVTIDYSQGLPVEVGYGAGELKPGESVVVYFNVTIN